MIVDHRCDNWEFYSLHLMRLARAVLLAIIPGILALSCWYEYDKEDEPQYVEPDCGPPTGVIHPDHFWFVHITDIHQSRLNGSDIYPFAIKTRGTYENFLDQLIYIHDVIKPAFVVATGDLVDGGILEQVSEQWEDYRHGVWGACYDATTFHDLPGNHDVYYDPASAFYLTYSISRVTHHTWTVENDAGRFAFAAMNSTSPGSNEADLTDEEREWLVSALEEAADYDYRILFAHHNIPNDQTGELFGANGILATNEVHSFVAGHIHRFMEWNMDGILYFLTDAMYKPGPYSNDGLFRVFSFDGLDMASVGGSILNHGPQVLIASPQDRYYSTLANPDGHIVSGTTAVRVLAFSQDPISVSAAVDDGVPVAMTRIGDLRYEILIDFDEFATGPHEIVAWADGFADSNNTCDRIEVISQ